MYLLFCLMHIEKQLQFLHLPPSSILKGKPFQLYMHPLSHTHKCPVSAAQACRRQKPPTELVTVFKLKRVRESRFLSDTLSLTLEGTICWLS